MLQHNVARNLLQLFTPSASQFAAGLQHTLWTFQEISFFIFFFNPVCYFASSFLFLVASLSLDWYHILHLKKDAVAVTVNLYNTF
mmetsp:Transcript_16824/g.21827  ORF Transcript_16824/g.21827 Transcript_16824/m.21827 type:complete len:85 (+) Transcript_16824:1310-1564(+)